MSEDRSEKLSPERKFTIVEFGFNPNTEKDPILKKAGETINTEITKMENENPDYSMNNLREAVEMHNAYLGETRTVNSPDSYERYTSKNGPVDSLIPVFLKSNDDDENDTQLGDLAIKNLD